MKAMILAAGLGTRLQPLTDKSPKALIEIRGVPLLEHTIRYLKYFGINEIIINVHHFADQIIDFLKTKNHFQIRIEVSDERNELLDTGGGLMKAGWFFDNSPFILTASDVITSLDLKSMIEFHDMHKPLATLAVKHRNSTREFLFDSENRLSGWVNHITGEMKITRQAEPFQAIAFSTIHIIDPLIFGMVTEKGAFSITDLYLRLAAEKIILGFRHEDSEWLECGRIQNIDSLNTSDTVKEIFHRYHI